MPQSAVPDVRLGVAAEDVPSQDVQFDTSATVSAGRFAASISGVGGARRVWARICLGNVCETRSTPARWVDDHL